VAPEKLRSPGEGPPRTGNTARSDPRRRLGALGEELAAAHYGRLGFAVLERNARTRHGEIDLIVFDGSTLAFVEVKTRRSTGREHPRGGVPPAPLSGLRAGQRLRLRRLATAWLCVAREGRPSAATIRFDAVGVVLDPQGRLLSLDHIEGAW
jgi:putative endonuclease